LYLPPFWFHHVTALDLSISVNIWSDSKEFLIMDGILKSALPFEDYWSNQDKALTVKKYIMHLVEGVWGKARSPRILKDLLDVRYQQFMTVLIPSIGFEFCGNEGSVVLDDDVLLKSVNNVKERFLEILNDSVRSMMMGNFIEELANWAVGVNNVGMFLASCFNNNG